jgi:hypothetical protein
MPTTVDDRVRELTGRAELGGAVRQPTDSFELETHGEPS